MSVGAFLPCRDGNPSYSRHTPADVRVQGLRAVSGHSVYSSTLNSTMGHRARACYLKRFAIGPAAAKLAGAISA
jgi:hypothetical protein